MVHSRAADNIVFFVMRMQCIDDACAPQLMVRDEANDNCWCGAQPLWFFADKKTSFKPNSFDQLSLNVLNSKLLVYF